MEPPLRLTVFAWEAQPGRLSMTVSCELTVKLAHGAEAQIVEASPFFDEFLRHLAEADVRAPFKPRCDVLVIGNAYTPAAEPEVDRLLIRVRIGEWTKAVRVTGDRFWLRDPSGRLVPGPARKFRRMLLTQERAPRTPETPLGIDVDAVPIEHRIAVPNLEPASVGYSAMLGPVAQNAPSRAGLIHPMTLGWVHATLSGQRAGPPPEGFNFGFFNLAPGDQQLPEIPVGAAIVLENLHPEEPVFTSRIPSVRPRAFVFDPQKLQQVEIPLRCDTLWIDADRAMATLVFRGVLPISHPDLATQVVTKIEQVEREVRAPDPEMLETRLGATARNTGLPFLGAPANPPALRMQGDTEALRLRPPGSAPAARAPAGPRAPLPGQMFVTQEISLGTGLDALPFDGLGVLPGQGPEEETTQNLGDDPTTASNARLPPPRSDAGVRKPPPPSAPSHGILDEPSSGVYSPLPPGMERVVVRLSPPDIGPTPMPPLPPKPAARAPQVRNGAHAITSDPTPPAPAPKSRGGLLGDLRLGEGQLATSLEEPSSADATADATSTEASSADSSAKASVPPVTNDDDEPRTAARVKPTDPPTSPPAPGASLPVEPPNMQAAKAADKQRRLLEELTDSFASPNTRGIEARTLEEAEADADRDAFEFPLPPSDGFEVDGVTLDHCAAIRAAFAMAGSNRLTVLAKHDLDEAAFARIEKAHLARIDQENSSGAHDLLNRYDAAYVAEQDKLRRPIGVKEYARIVVARKRGELAEVMNELGVPRSELMRLDRVWKRRAIEYPEVGENLRLTVASMGETW